MSYGYATRKAIEEALKRGDVAEAEKQLPDPHQDLTDPEILELLRLGLDYGFVPIVKRMLERFGYFEDGQRTDKAFHSDEYRGWVEQNVEKRIKSGVYEALNNGRIEILEFCNDYPEVYECENFNEGITESGLVSSFMRSEPDPHTLHRFVEMLDDFTYDDFTNYPEEITKAAPEACEELLQSLSFTGEQRKAMIRRLAWSTNEEGVRAVLQFLEPTDDEAEVLLSELIEGSDRETLYLTTMGVVLDELDYDDRTLEQATLTVLDQAFDYAYEGQPALAVQALVRSVDHFENTRFASALDVLSSLENGASADGFEEVIATLLENCDVSDEALRALLEFAMEQRPFDAGLTLIQEVLDRNLALDEELEEELLVWVCSIRGAHNGQLSVLRMLLEHGLGPNTKNDRHIVNLMKSIITDNTRRHRLEMLLDYGASLGHPDVQKELTKALESDRPQADAFREWMSRQGFELTGRARRSQEV